MQNNVRYRNILKILITVVVFFELAYIMQNCTSKNEQEEETQKGDTGSLEMVELTDEDYVGTETCRSCHQESYDDWHQSHHDLAMMKPDAESVKGDFSDITFTSQGVTSRFYKKDGKFFVNTEGPEGTYQDYEIIYTFGITPLQQYIVEFPNGKLQCLRTAWDTEENKWFDLYPDFHIAPDEWLHWSRGGLNWNTMCSDCHSTNVHKNYNEKLDAFNTTYSIIDVSCEACHGPGKEHVNFVNAPEFDSTEYYDAEEHMYLTSALLPKEQVDQCARCHVRRVQITDAYNHQGEFMDHYVPEILRDNLYFADGQILDEDYVYGSFVQSKMYKLNVKCTDCHNPHSLELKAIGNALCAQCHDTKVYDTPDHHFHPMNTESSQCVNCHMTGRYYMVNDFRRDHSFRVPRPDLTVEFETPNACNGCHEDESPEWAAESVEKWYGPERVENYADILALGSTRTSESVDPLIKLSGDTTEPGIARATALWYLSQMASQESVQAIINRLNDYDHLVRYTAINSLIDLPVEQKLQYITPLLDDEIRSVRVAAVGALADAKENQIPDRFKDAYAMAFKEYNISLQSRADFPGGQFEKGQFFDRQGEAHLAELHYLQAIEKDNLFNPARVNLAHLYNRQGRNEESIDLFRTIVKLEPDYGPAYYSLGLLYAEQKQLDSAVTYLQKAASLENNPRIYYNLGLAYQQINQNDKAESAYISGLAIDPNNPDIHNALAIMFIQQEKYQKAKPHAQRLLELYPNNQQLQQMMNMINQGIKGQ